MNDPDDYWGYYHLWTYCRIKITRLNINCIILHYTTPMIVPYWYDHFQCFILIISSYLFRYIIPTKVITRLIQQPCKVEPKIKKQTSQKKIQTDKIPSIQYFCDKLTVSQNKLLCVPIYQYQKKRKFIRQRLETGKSVEDRIRNIFLYVTLPPLCMKKSLCK